MTGLRLQVLKAIAYGKEESLPVSLNSIADYLGFSGRRQVVRVVADLRDMGFIVTSPCSRYVLTEKAALELARQQE